MAQKCILCEKTINRAWRLVKLRGKYNPTVKRTQRPNLQWATLSEQVAARFGLTEGRVKACTKCIKSLTKKGKKTPKAS
ncbi:MAG: hypothetical protein HYW98_00205 [Candidatus Wildermuthbacteria bacterium]|nr:hypothetical protein [Candidatus Wildermuthbacteria bacterium]